MNSDVKYTPYRITALENNEIFVFGSNLAGHHAGGAARLAFDRFGAVWGQGEGLQGNSYAIPTMQGGVETIKPYVDRFIEFAKQKTDLTFYVTKIGCGIAGFSEKEIAPLFRSAYNLPNVILPVEFAGYIEKENRSIHPQRILDTMDAAHEARVKHCNTPIKIIGVGSSGSKAVDRMIENPLDFVEYAILSDNLTTIKTSKVPNRLYLQDSDPCTAKPFSSREIYERYFVNPENYIYSILDDTVKQLIIVSGFGGESGTLCSKWLASLAKSVNIPVIVVCTIPFDFEGKKKQERALNAAYSLIADGVDVKILKAEELTNKYPHMSFPDCFSYLDEYIAETVTQIYEELSVSLNKVDNIVTPTLNKLPDEITTHCYGITRTFADIILGLNESKRYTSPDEALSDLSAYLQRFKENGDEAAFLAVKIIKQVLHDSRMFIGYKLNTSRLRKLVYEKDNFISASDKAYDFYCREKMINLIAYLNEFRRYRRQIAIEHDLIAIENASKVRIFKLSFCRPTETPIFFEMQGATGMNYPVQFFVRAIRNLWPEIITDGVLDAAKMRKLMFGNHDDAVCQLGLEGAISRDFVTDSPCHPEVFVPKVMGTAPIYVKDAATGRYMRSCGEGKGPNAIPDWLEFQIAKLILEKDNSYKLIGNYYIPKYDNTLPVYGEYSGRIAFNTQAEKIRFIEDVKQGKNAWR